VIPAPVGYRRAESVEEALEALREPEARLLAGGQSLVPVMKLRIMRPSLLVDIGGLDLGGIAIAGGELRIGALTTWDELARAAELERPALRAIAECAGRIGDQQIRNRGTLGGGLAHADPASDMPAVALALGARLTIRSSEGVRALDAAEFFLGPYTSALGQTELLTEVVIPLPTPGSGSAYVAVEHPASGFALAGAAVLTCPDGSTRVALTGVGARGHAFLLPEDEEPANAIAAADIYGDRFAPADYRRNLARVVAERALAVARERAERDRT
jgi:carbon-monoxide dehydrogenase medium subunit